MTKNKYRAIKKNQPLTKKLSTLALLTMSSLFFSPEKAKANNSWQPESLQGISQLKFALTKDCEVGSSKKKLSSEIQTYLKKWGIPIISGEPQEQDTYIKINISCHRAIQSYQNANFEIQIIQSISLKEKTRKAIIYNNQWFGLTGVYFYEEEQRIILNLLKEFISDWQAVR